MISTQALKNLPGTGESKRGRRKGDVSSEAGAGRTVNNRRGVSVIDRKEVGGDGPIKYFYPTGSEVALESQRE